MKTVRLKPFLRVYKREGEPHLFLGLGPDKVRLADPTDEMVEFVLALGEARRVSELRLKFQETDEWLASLERVGVLEDAALEPVVTLQVARRWSRQINYLRLYDREGWDGFEGMRRIRDARVIVVGTGAGGTTLLRLLNAAGVGRLEAVDFDTIAEDNLPTHTTLDEQDVGSPKLETLRRHLLRQNSSTEFVVHHRKVESPDDLTNLVRGTDFFVYAFDRPRNLAARWSNEASLRTGVPITSIGTTDKGARVGPTVLPGQSPCLECIGIYDFDVLRKEQTAALTGSTVAMLAGIAVNEVIALLAGAKTSRTVGQSLYINTDTLTFTFNEYEFRNGCVCTKYRTWVPVTAAAAK